jgi:peptidoglycan hydrolase-like protein with peptidoglycan-binding domain
MAQLTSQWFTSNLSPGSAARLQAAADSNSRAIWRAEPDNEAVQAIQLAMANFYLMPKSIQPDGKPGGTADGKFGDETNNAVWGYQGQRHLKQDGKVGPHTLAALDKDMQDKKPPKIVHGGGATPAGPEDPKALAESSKGMALTRVNSAISELLWYRLSAVGERDPHRLEVMISALNTHFGFDRKENAATTDDSLLDTIVDNFSKDKDALTRSATVFQSVTQAQYDADRPGKSLVPAYASTSRWVKFTTMFKRWDSTTATGYGDQTRAAMLIHECIHFVDTAAPDHAYEWQGEYDALKAEKAVHNPSSYATFAAHIARGYDRPRPGAGNQWL